jgi:hypothetical protein
MTTAQVVDLIRDEHALDLEFVGWFAGGEVGAADVRGADDSRYVLKWWPGDNELGRVRQSVALVERLRDRGYPAPRYLLIDAVDGVTVTLQEHLEGAVADTVSDVVIDELLRLNDLQQAACDADDGSWHEYIRLSLTEGCDGYCVHESLREYDSRTASLLAEIQGVGQSLVEQLPSGDVVHVDFHHRNVLVLNGKVGAVIDWEGCRPGDRGLDLVTFAFGPTVASVSGRARKRVWQAVCDHTEPEVRRAYVAHMALRQVDWSIRHRTAADVDHWLGVSCDFLERPAAARS